MVAAGRGISCVLEWWMCISELTPVDFEGYGPTEEIQRETEARLKGASAYQIAHPELIVFLGDSMES